VASFFCANLMAISIAAIELGVFMSDEDKTMSAVEFRELGLLQEVNRLFFHPRGLALVFHFDKVEY